MKNQKTKFEDEFTYNCYCKMLQLFKDSGYRFCEFDYKNNDKKSQIFLRHDVDVDWFSAPRLRRIERQEGCVSTWLLLPSDDFYNMLSQHSIETAKDISDSGGILGLHIDPKVLKNSDIKTALEQTYNYYKNFINIQKVISFHRPGNNLEDVSAKIDGFVNVYEPQFCSDIKYVSDSNRRPFFNQQLMWDALEKNDSLTILSHPIWWSDEGRDLRQTFEHIVKAAKDDIALRALKNNIKVFNELGVSNEQ